MSILIRSFSALTLSLAAGAVLAQQSPVTVKQDGQTFEHFCAEEEGATFIGSNNQIKTSGGCTTIRIEGSNNVVSIGRTTGIEINGDGNQVSWQSSAVGKSNSRPPISDVGKNNVIRSAEELAQQ